MKKKLLQRSLLGAPIGVLISLIITLIFSLCMGKGEYFPAPHELIEFCGSENVAVIVQLICSLLIGAISAGSSVIFEIEKWSLLKQTLVHFAVISVPFIGIGYIMNWLPHNWIGALCYVGGFIIMYVITWFAMYFSIKAKIKKMNAQLQEMQPDESGQEKK